MITWSDDPVHDAEAYEQWKEEQIDMRRGDGWLAAFRARSIYDEEDWDNE